LRSTGEDPLDNIHESPIGVKQGSKVGDNATRAGIHLNQTLGLGDFSPKAMGSKLPSTIKVYVRRKAFTPTNYLGQGNNNPNEQRNEAQLRKKDTLEFGSHTLFPESKEMSPEKACLAHSPVSSSSFNKGIFDNEKTLHREIIRDLGVSFAENTTTEENNNASTDFNSVIISTSAGVMGMKSMEP